MASVDERKASGFVVSTGLKANDNIIALATSNGVTNNAVVSVGHLLANSQSDHAVANGYNMILSSNVSPANSASIPGIKKGTLWCDGTYIYYSDAPGHVKRTAALGSF